jgi:Domain of unknown function (DUF4262)
MRAEDMARNEGEIQLKADDEALLALVDECGWHDLDIAPRRPDPDWRPDKSELTDRDRKLLDDVAAHGWHHLHIHPERGRDPLWSFTVGLPATWQHPELVIFGLDMEVCQQLFEGIVDDVAGGRSFAAGDEADDVLEGYPVRFVAVRPHWYSSFLGYAQWFHESDAGFPVLQLVWPDRDGRWPWDPACSLRRGTQPLLGPA